MFFAGTVKPLYGKLKKGKAKTSKQIWKRSFDVFLSGRPSLPHVLSGTGILQAMRRSLGRF